MEIVSNKVTLSSPISMKMLKNSHDGAIHIALSYEELVYQLNKNAKDFDMADDKLILDKLAILAFSFPELRKELDRFGIRTEEESATTL